MAWYDITKCWRRYFCEYRCGTIGRPCEPSLERRTLQPRDRSPPRSCRYINSSAIIGVCAFSHKALWTPRRPLWATLFASLALGALSLPLIVLDPRPGPLSITVISSSSSSAAAAATATSPFRLLLSRQLCRTAPVSCLFFLASSSVC